MHFHKYPYPANFEFPTRITKEGCIKTQKGAYRIKIRAGDADIYHIQVSGKEWKTNDSQAGLQFSQARPGAQGAQTKLTLTPANGLRLEHRDGRTLLSAPPAQFFGQCGGASIFKILREEGDRFYGMGEKWNGFEHSGKTTKFWNTDIWADFNRESFVNGKPGPDPTYVSIPYLIIKRGNTFIGLLLDNPHAAFISTGAPNSIANQMELRKGNQTIHLGSEQGQPNLYIIFGPSLAELTRKLQHLVGVTPRPPAWALGYQQCRWGYQSQADLTGLDAQFRKHKVPVDGLWLDIDYMDAYKVFTLAEKHFPNPPQAFTELAKAGRKVVPIIDPGVKREPGYGVYERGRKADAFCVNPQGREYVGLVWPGETVFPDFSDESARAWWAKEVSGFAKLGIHGAWLDMNDPSTGPVENQDMLFDHGRKSHSSFHNQFALGMAMASRQGFLDAHPGERPFLLSRSGFTGSGRYTAIWTGDNYSNYHHLKNSIATTLNLALSGIPFNGPDAGGFGGDTNAELIADWYKAGFLFPFFRNHAITGSRKQEPWMFGKKTLSILRRYIQWRYRLRPYLYQLFIRQELTGEAILRPLFYDFEDTKALPLGLIDDQFMAGPSIMQAPFVAEKQKAREVVLPGKCKWYSLAEDHWLQGNRKITVRATELDTPVFIRDGSILPLARLKPEENAFESHRIDFHVFLSGDKEAGIHYVFDDGKTFDYRNGRVSEAGITAKRSGDTMRIEVATLLNGFAQGDFTFTTRDSIRKLTVNGAAAVKCPAQGVAFGTGKKTTTWKA